jgi:hypothetical protein
MAGPSLIPDRRKTPLPASLDYSGPEIERPISVGRMLEGADVRIIETSPAIKSR